MPYKTDPAYKAFIQLPDILSPIQNPVRPSEDIIGLIPVFADPYFNEYNFSAFLKVAIYSQQSFLRHTDALNKAVSIKFYIDNACKLVATPVLEKNGFDIAKDVLWFDAPPLPDTKGGIWNKLGKKSVLYWDTRLADYDKVVYWDVDTFKLNEKIFKNLFARIGQLDKVLSFIQLYTWERRYWRPRMIRQSVKNVRYGDIPIQTIFEKADLGRVLQNIQGSLTKPIGLFAVYPAKVFHSDNQDFIQWLQNHAPYIGHDEIAIALGTAKFGIQLYSLTQSWNFTQVSVLDYLIGNTQHALLHGKPIDDHVPAFIDILNNLITD